MKMKLELGRIYNIIAGSPPWEPRTAGRGTVAAAGRRPGPAMGPRLQC